MKASDNILLHPFLQTAVVGRGSGQALHTRQYHEGPLLHLQILGLLFWFCGIKWINLTPLFSLTPPRSSSHSISSCQSKSAINQSAMSSCLSVSQEMLPKWQPLDALVYKCCLTASNSSQRNSSHKVSMVCPDTTIGSNKTRSSWSSAYTQICDKDTQSTLAWSLHTKHPQ